MTRRARLAGCGKTASDGKPYPVASLCEQYTLMQGGTLYGTPGEISTPPLPKPRFVLTDTVGAPFDFWHKARGYVTLLFFGYTYCPDQCPLHMANLGMALKKNARRHC